MFTFEERFNEGISGTDAKANGETAADVMKVVKEEVLLVSCLPRKPHSSVPISAFLALLTYSVTSSLYSAHSSPGPCSFFVLSLKRII